MGKPSRTHKPEENPLPFRGSAAAGPNGVHPKKARSDVNTGGQVARNESHHKEWRPQSAANGSE